MPKLLLAYFAGVLATLAYGAHHSGDNKTWIVMIVVSMTFFMAAYGMERRND